MKVLIIVGLFVFGVESARAGTTDERAIQIFDFLFSTTGFNKAAAQLVVDHESNSGSARVDYRQSMPAMGGLPPELVVVIDRKLLGRSSPLQTAVVIAHEIGHIIGEPAGGDLNPLLNLYFAVEGEADYQSGKILLRAYHSFPSKFQKLIMRESALPEDLQRGAEVALKDIKQLDGQTVLIASKILAAAFTNLREFADQNVDLSFSDFDHSKVKETLADYPSPQSRLDSVKAGLLGDKRPQSWAKPADFDGCEDFLQDKTK